jgi:hypothetical protein
MTVMAEPIARDAPAIRAGYRTHLDLSAVASLSRSYARRVKAFLSFLARSAPRAICGGQS